MLVFWSHPPVDYFKNVSPIVTLRPFDPRRSNGFKMRREESNSGHWYKWRLLRYCASFAQTVPRERLKSWMCVCCFKTKKCVLALNAGTQSWLLDCGGGGQCTHMLDLMHVLVWGSWIWLLTFTAGITSPQGVEMKTYVDHCPLGWNGTYSLLFIFFIIWLCSLASHSF